MRECILCHEYVHADSFGAHTLAEHNLSGAEYEHTFGGDMAAHRDKSCPGPK